MNLKALKSQQSKAKQNRTWRNKKIQNIYQIQKGVAIDRPDQLEELKANKESKRKIT